MSASTSSARKQAIFQQLYVLVQHGYFQGASAESLRRLLKQLEAS